MAISQDTTNRLNYAIANTVAATEVVTALNAPASSIPAGTITNAQLAPSALQSTGVLATSALGYAVGAGGTIIQITSRATGVTLSKLSGTIQTDTTSLAAEVSATFIVTNTLVAIGDVVVLAQRSGSNGGNTAVNVVTTAAGSFSIMVSNNNASGGTAETGAIIINFAVIKAVTT